MKTMSIGTQISSSVPNGSEQTHATEKLQMLRELIRGVLLTSGGGSIYHSQGNPCQSSSTFLQNENQHAMMSLSKFIQENQITIGSDDTTSRLHDIARTKEVTSAAAGTKWAAMASDLACSRGCCEQRMRQLYATFKCLFHFRQTLYSSWETQTNNHGRIAIQMPKVSQDQKCSLTSASTLDHIGRFRSSLKLICKDTPAPSSFGWQLQNSAQYHATTLEPSRTESRYKHKTPVISSHESFYASGQFSGNSGNLYSAAPWFEWSDELSVMFDPVKRSLITCITIFMDKFPVQVIFTSLGMAGSKDVETRDSFLTSTCTKGGGVLPAGSMTYLQCITSSISPTNGSSSSPLRSSNTGLPSPSTIVHSMYQCYSVLVLGHERDLSNIKECSVQVSLIINKKHHFDITESDLERIIINTSDCAVREQLGQLQRLFVACKRISSDLQKYIVSFNTLTKI